MPSDIRPIKVCACLSCGRTPAEGAVLKKLKTLSTFWACSECVAKFLFITNYDKVRALKLLEAEADRQFDAHIGKQPMSRACMRGCGSIVMAIPDTTKSKLGFRIPLFCSSCQREWIELSQGSADYKAETIQ